MDTQNEKANCYKCIYHYNSRIGTHSRCAHSKAVSYLIPSLKEHLGKWS